MVKQSLLLAVTMVAALAFWLVIKPLIEGSLSVSASWEGWQIQEVLIWLWPVILLAVLAGMIALSLFLVDSRMAWLTMVLNLVIFSAVFNPKEITVWGGVLIAFFFQFSARKIIREESKNRLHLDLKSTLHSGMGRLVTSILILISFAYFLSSGTQEVAQRKELPGAIRQTVRVVVGSYIGENQEIENPSLRAQATEKVLKQINNFLNPYFVFLPSIFAFSLFLILQGLSAVFIWLAIVLALLIFWVLKLLKLVKIERESKEAEVIKF